ncbi:GDSL-type esterase/lipase family protein (plasmid) [Clostridium perfringens]
MISLIIGFVYNGGDVFADSRYLIDRTLIKNYPNKAIEKLENGASANIVFFGDSNTDCNYGYDSNEGVLNKKVDKHPEIIEKLLKDKYGWYNVSVINSGVHGNNVKDLNDRVYRDVISYKPDLVVLNIGTNDSNEGWKEKFIPINEYEVEYNRLIKTILNSNPNIDIIIRSSNYLFGRNTKLSEYDSIARKLAEKYDLEFWDFNYIMTNDIKNNKVKVNDRAYSEGSAKLFKEPLITDGVHLTFSGQKYLAENFYYLFTKDKVFDNFYLSRYIDNFYKLAFDREADYGGKVFWYNKLKNHEESLRYFITNLIYEKEFIEKNYSDYNFIDRLYKIIFEREPDSGGFNFWVNKYKEKKIELGISKAQKYVIDSLLNSDEFKEKAFLLSVEY